MLFYFSQSVGIFSKSELCPSPMCRHWSSLHGWSSRSTPPLVTVSVPCLWITDMQDEIFHFEIFRNFMKIWKHFKTPSLKYFMKFLILSNFDLNYKNMIKVYEVSRKYIMLFVHNNRYLPLTGLLTYFVLPAKNREIFWNISEICHEIFHEIFHAKKFHEILHHYSECTHADDQPLQAVVSIAQPKMFPVSKCGRRRR